MLTGYDIVDHNSQEAAYMVLLQLEEKDDWEDEIDDIMRQFEREAGRQPVFTVCFY